MHPSAIALPISQTQEPSKSDIVKKEEPLWNGRVVILWAGLGEFAWAKRLENCCKRLGWNCNLSFSSENLSEYDKLVQEVPVTKPELEKFINNINPDCVISLKTARVFSDKTPHYLSATGVIEKLFDKSFSPNEEVLAFHGVLQATQEVQKLKQYFEQHGKPFRSLNWFPSCAATEYLPVVSKRLFFCGFQWDKKRNGEEYRNLFSRLDKEGYLDIYGPKEHWDCAPNSVKGFTFDEEEFRRAMRNSGIVLVLHAQNNLDLGAPAARIFEAAAASCIAICDKHPFVMREFGDCVFYVDHTQSGELLFQEIEKHRNWIVDNPKEAELMARRAHAIFLEKFTLEKQLQDLKSFHLQSRKHKL